LNSLPPTLPVQGNLDPVALVTGGQALRDGIRTILDHAKGRPLIFNLGHGVPQTTPPDHVAELVRLGARRMTTRRAVVLFNLGGPDSLESVSPVSCSTCSTTRQSSACRSRSAVGLPPLWRSGGRRRQSRSIVTWVAAPPCCPTPRIRRGRCIRRLGGGSDTRIFIAMRYWHPFTVQTATDVQDWGPDEIILLPLYPQYSHNHDGFEPGRLA